MSKNTINTKSNKSEQPKIGRLPGVGQGNIGALMDTNAAPEDAKARALWRTMLIKNAFNGRCTSAEDLQDRFERLFNLCLENNFVPTVEMLAVASGYSRRTLIDIEREKCERLC